MANPSYTVSDFGMTKYGEKASKYTLNGAGGVVLEVSDYGGKAIRLSGTDRVEICRADCRTQLVRLTGKNFYQLLNQKLGGGRA
jgi:hypothetical protein